MYDYETFGHGGDYSGDFLDFSANVSPLGVPDTVKTALHALVDSGRLADYPDPFCTELRASIARHAGVSPDRVLCGNGAADLIHRLAAALRPKRAVILEPTFTEYAAALEKTGCEVVHARWDDVLDGTPAPEGDLLVLCSPNNPTGASVETAVISALLRQREEQGSRLLWDASFLEFSARRDEYCAFIQRTVPDHRNLLVLQSLTKAFALPGLRLGYLLTSAEDLMEDVYEAGAPWSVSAAAQTAGVAALEDRAYLERLRETVRDERTYLQHELLPLADGPEGEALLLRSDANFLLLKTARADLAEQLEGQGIRVRTCPDFAGLDETVVRIAIRAHEDNERLVNALKEVPWNE